MKIPAKTECMKMLRDENVPDNIVRHSVMVAKVARHLAERLRQAGEDVNVGLVEAAALLHDLSKFKCLDMDLHHAKDAGGVLRRLGYPEVAGVVEKHLLDAVIEPGTLKTWEEKVVYYADKRVTNDRLTSLDERFAYLEKRYPMAKDTIEKSRKPLKALEEGIFSRIGESPELDNLKAGNTELPTPKGAGVPSKTKGNGTD